MTDTATTTERALTELRAQTTQIYQIYIRASAEKIWQALIDPDFTEKYFHHARIVNTPERHVSHGPKGDKWGDGAVTVFEPPHRLVHEWRSLYSPELALEATSRITWEIEPQDGGFCLLTAVHDQLEGAPKTAAGVAGPGWMLILSGLKTLLETGEPLVP